LKPLPISYPTSRSRMDEVSGAAGERAADRFVRRVMN
jgi:hypothetical protein